MYRLLLTFVCMIFVFSSVEGLQLKGEFRKAVCGDFLVFEQDRLITLMLISKKEGSLLTIEEISITEKKWQSLNKFKTLGWKTWIQNKAPKNCSWVIYDIDLNTGNILQAYSFTKRSKVEKAPQENFLPTLLNLHFSKIPLEERKRTGKSLLQGDIDKRNLWNPPLVFEGTTSYQVQFEAFRARWPKDTSFLSGTLIEIYLPQDELKAPSYFPYWLHLSDQFTKAKLHIIDSGTNLVSPYNYFPNQQ